MKPTQQEIIELSREHATRYTNRHYPDKPVFTFTQDALQKVIELALERFGAGGGEPARGVVIRDGLPTLLSDRDIKTSDTRLYTHPSPADLRAEYLRGLEDAAKVCEAKWSNVAEKMYGKECAAAIRALKGKQ